MKVHYEKVILLILIGLIVSPIIAGRGGRDYKREQISQMPLAASHQVQQYQQPSNDQLIRRLEIKQRLMDRLSKLQQYTQPIQHNNGPKVTRRNHSSIAFPSVCMVGLGVLSILLVTQVTPAEAQLREVIGPVVGTVIKKIGKELIKAVAAEEGVALIKEGIEKFGPTTVEGLQRQTELVNGAMQGSGRLIDAALTGLERGSDRLNRALKMRAELQRAAMLEQHDTRVNMARQEDKDPLRTLFTEEIVNIRRTLPEEQWPKIAGFQHEDHHLQDSDGLIDTALTTLDRGSYRLNRALKMSAELQLEAMLEPHYTRRIRDIEESEEWDRQVRIYQEQEQQKIEVAKRQQEEQRKQSMEMEEYQRQIEEQRRHEQQQREQVKRKCTNDEFQQFVNTYYIGNYDWRLEDRVT